MPDLISVLLKLHIPKSLGLFIFIRLYIISSFKVLCQTLFEKIDLTIMERASAAFERAEREGSEDSRVNDLSLRQLNNIRKFKNVKKDSLSLFIFILQ